jgi:hypothetical protein
MAWSAWHDPVVGAADADIVTIRAGGNDLQFAGSLLYAASMRLEPQAPSFRAVRSDFHSHARSAGVLRRAPLMVAIDLEPPDSNKC